MFADLLPYVRYKIPFVSRPADEVKYHKQKKLSILKQQRHRECACLWKEPHQESLVTSSDFVEKCPFKWRVCSRGQFTVNARFWRHRLQGYIGAVTERWANSVSMSGQRRRRWSNNKTTLVQRFVFAVIAIKSTVALNSDLLLMKLLGNNSTVNSSLTVLRPRTVILKAINPRHVIGPRWPPRPITWLISRSTVLRIFDQGPLYPSAFPVLCFISPNAVIWGFQPMLF